MNPRDARKASEPAAHAPAQRLELQLGHQCNNRCVFCVSGQLSALGVAPQIPVEPILSAIDDAFARGIGSITLLGGEPTTQKSFLPALRHAVALGFREIVIFTNGVTSTNRSFIDRVVAMGRFTWRFSIQGGTEDAHDRVTGVPGSFRRIITGLTYLKELDQRVTANMCVNELSYRSLPHYPALVREYNIRDLHIDMVRPAHAGTRTDGYLQSILPRFSSMVPYIRQMLEEFARVDPGYDVNIGNFPFCLLPEWSHKIHHGGERTALMTPDAAGDMQPIDDKYGHQWSDMLYGPECGACALRSECRGVPSKYAQFHGFDELRPLTKQHLQAVTHDGRMFAQIIDPLLKNAYMTEPPAPWRQSLVSRHTRDGLIALSYEHQGGAATLIFSRPGTEAIGGGTCLWDTHHYRVTLRHDEQSPYLPQLVTWLHSVLRIRVQTRIASSVKRIRAAHFSDGWHYSGSRTDVDSLGVTAFIESDSGRRIGVVMTPGAAGDSRIRITFDLGETEPVQARGVIENVTAALAD